MSQDNDQQSSSGFRLRHFEKNRYFQGKLMTARDMLADQQYHADRLETLTKLTAGTGILAGLEISEFEDEGDRLAVTVEPGVAVDPHGRPVVVRNPSTQTLPKPEGSEVFVYIEFDTEQKDPVPVPGEEATGETASEESRILEVFSITARETPPEFDDTEPVELPDFDTTDKSPAELADEIAAQYHEQRRTQIEPGTDPVVFLGSFVRTTDGDWRPGGETVRRPFVYDTRMLYELLITHLTDTDNPHATRIGEPTDYIESELDEIEGFSVRLQQLRSEMQELTDKLEIHTDYVARKSLESGVRFFDGVATDFEEVAPVSRAALDVAEAIRGALADDVPADRDRYQEFVATLVADVRDLADALDGKATEESYRTFTTAVEELEAATEDQTNTVRTATALDRVGETAQSLQPRYDVVPQGGELSQE